MSQEVYCTKCTQFYRKITSGLDVTLGVRSDKSSVFVRGDLYECPECKNQVVSDFGTPFERPGK